MKRRILQLTGSFNQGGSERQAVSLASRLRAEGTFEVWLATLNNDGPLREQAAAAGFELIEEFPLTSFYNANFVSQIRKCSKFLTDNRIELVHTHDFYTNVFGMAAATLAGVNVRVASKRETGGMRTKAQDLVERMAFGRASAVVANSAAVKEYLTGCGIRSDKIEVIYNGLDLSRFDINADRLSTLRKYGIEAEAGDPVVTLVANLRHDVKNIPMLLRGAKTVIATVPSARFVIAGEGGLEDELKGIASGLGIAERVHFIGRCTNVPELLAASDVCVLTSIAEGFSNSILEYMAAGRPVVATKVGGANEAIAENDSGYMVASDDDAALADRLLQLISDHDKARSFGEKGRQIVAERFSAERQLRDTIGLYERLFTAS